MRTCLVLIAVLLMAVSAQASTVPWIMSASTTSTQGATSYAGVLNGPLNFNATETNRYNTIQAAGTFSNLYVRVSANGTSGGGGGSPLTFRVNQVDSALTLTITAGSTGEFEFNASVAVVVDDEISVKLVTGGGGGAGILIRALTINFAATSDTVALLGMGPVLDISTDSVTQFNAFSRGTTNGTTTAADGRNLIRTAGTLEHMFVNVTTNGRGTNTVIGTRINGSNGNLLITIGGGTTGLIKDAGGLSDAVASGDFIGLRFTTSTGGGTLTYAYQTVEFRSTNGAIPQTGFGSNGMTLANGASSYFSFGSANVSTTEADYQYEINQAMNWSNTVMRVSANATSSLSTLKSRVNGSNGTQTVDIGSGSTGDFETAGTDTLAANDNIGMVVNNGGGGDITARGLTTLFAQISAPSTTCTRMLLGVGPC